MALAEQLETIDKSSLVEKMGVITSEAIMYKITIAIQVQTGVY